MTGAVRVAIVGCGRMGTERARHVDSAGSRIVACVDGDADRARELSSKYPGASALSDTAAVLWSGVDAVFLCTPPSVRLEAVLRAIESGVAVFTEKPIGLSAVDGRRLTDAASHRGVLNAVGYMNRYRPAVRKARMSAAESGASGLIGYWAGKRYAVPWWERADQSGGPFNEQATHLVDLCRFVCGDIVEVRAVAGTTRDAGGLSRAAVAARFESGTIGALLYTCEAADKHIGLHVITSVGTVELRGWDFIVQNGSRPPVEPNVFETETHAFLRAVRTGDRGGVLCDFADATKTQATVDAIRKCFDAD